MAEYFVSFSFANCTGADGNKGVFADTYLMKMVNFPEADFWIVS
jgi:hypothetical protein